MSTTKKKEEEVEYVHRGIGTPGGHQTERIPKAEAEAKDREERMWKRIREILKDCDGPDRLASDLEKLVHLAVVQGGASGDGLDSDDCNTLFWPWELMRALRLSKTQNAA